MAGPPAHKAGMAPTRMAPRLAPAPRAGATPTATTATVAKVVQIVKKPAKKPVILRSNEPVDDQFKVRVTFSPAYGDNAGATWSEPLQIDDPTTAAGQEFYWRADIDQFRVDPLLQGFEIRWDLLTAGWTFADGVGATTYEEAISNPLVVARVVKAPASITASPNFKVVVTKKYRP